MCKQWLLIAVLALACFIGQAFASSNAPAALYVDQPLKIKGTQRWALPGFATDPAREHIYGIAFEARGAPGSVVYIDWLTLQRNDGTSLKGSSMQNMERYGVRTAVNDQWREGRAEFFTKRGTARLIATMSVKGSGETFIRNIRLVEGGFPDNPPLKGPPYLDWIETLQPNAAYADTNMLYSTKWPFRYNFSSSASDIELAKKIQPYLEVPVETLIKLMPPRRPMESAHGNSADYSWDPRNPDVLTDKTGKVINVETLYPITGYEEVTTPSGKIVKYPYYDPPGTTAPSRPTRLAEGMVNFTNKWIAFGPFKKDDPAPDKKALNSLPSELIIGGRKEQGREIVFKDSQVDLGDIFGGKEAGKTVYVFTAVDSERDTTITMGAGCDWWMQWWVNGECVYDTTQTDSGNIFWPPSWTDHIFDVSLRKGRNIIAARAVSGTGSFKFTAVGPSVVGWALNQGWPLFNPPPPEERVYLDQYMTAVRVRELRHAADVLTHLYGKNKNRDYALRAAAILWSLSKAIPDWPIYGQEDWGKHTVRFLPPDTYDCWFAFIIGGWYTPSMDYFTQLARLYDALRFTPVWEDLAKTTGQPNPRADIENALLHAAKMSLKYDAWFRTNPWIFFHNTIGAQIKAYIEIGRAVGCPELVHYAIQKAAMTLRYTFMVDGMFPESVSYLHDMAGGLCGQFSGALCSAAGYGDPRGFTAKIDGRHMDAFDIEKEIPFYKRVHSVMDRLRFPDASLLTVHDTWSDSQSPANEYWRERLTRSTVYPYLLPEFGHAILGEGSRPDWLESHLHYSGRGNHSHQDMLAFTLWAYGDELTANGCYTHLGGYGTTTLSHNLVVVDGKAQYPAYWDYTRGDLLAYFPNQGTVQAVQASGVNAYTNTDCYRRAIINIPFKTGEVAVVDIFEVSGGSRQEWMANGCADYEQKMETTLTDPVRKLPNLAEDGKPVKFGPNGELPGDECYYVSVKKSVYYGAFFNAEIFKPALPWEVTMTAGAPVPAGTPGAGPRAITNEPKPGLRLHWLAPLDGEAILCQAPRQRYYQEVEHIEVARKAWDKDLMPKIIVRRDNNSSSNRLTNTFLAVWEPFHSKPWLGSANSIPEISVNDGLGVRLSDGTNTAVILYRKPESQAVLTADTSPSPKTGGSGNKLTSNARFTVLRRIGEETMLDVYDGTEAQSGDLEVKLVKYPDMKVDAVVQSNGEFSVMVEDLLNGYPANAADQPHAGQYIVFRQSGQPFSRWLPLVRVGESENGKRRLVLDREPGFEFDAKQNLLCETFYPFRVFQGPPGDAAALVSLPAWVNLKWHKTAEGGVKVELNASGDVELHFKGLNGNVKCRTRIQGSDKWTDASADVDAKGRVVIKITADSVAKWHEICLNP